jgi:cytochrome c553
MRHAIATSLCLPGLVLCLYGATTQALADDKSAPPIVHTTCFMCHSEHGNDPDLGFVPRLAGQNATYIEGQVNAFRDGSRADPPAIIYMWPVAQNLSNDQIKQAAEWYAAQPAPQPVPVDGTVDEGRSIYMNGILAAGVAACVSCHGPKADGNAIFPRLAGQTPQYLLAQLRFFRAAVRNDTSAEIMKPVALHLTDDQMIAVSKYLGSL